MLVEVVARTSSCLRRLAGGRRSGIVGFFRFFGQSARDGGGRG